jgi:hypothetical protein
VPDEWTLLGAAIIACCGFYTVHLARMQFLARKAVAD